MTRARRRLAPIMAMCLATCALAIGGGPHTGVWAQTPDIQDLPVGKTVSGRGADLVAVDTYRFTLAAVERIAVTVDPPPDGAVAVSVSETAGQPLAVVAAPPIGAPWAWVGQLGPGAYQVDLRAALAGTGEYRLRVERLDPFAVSQDQEPNDTPARARPLPPSLELSGARDADADVDWYSLGTLAAPAAITLTTSGAPGTVRVSDGTIDFPTVADTTDATATRLRTVVLPAALPLYMRVEPDGAYAIRVDSGAPPVMGPPVPAPLFEAEMMLATTPETVAADLGVPQRLPGVLSIQNEESDDTDLTLDAVTSDDAWTVSVEQPQIHLAGGAVVMVPFVVEVPPSAPADIPVRITIRAREANGAQATGFVDITPRPDAAPVPILP